MEPERPTARSNPARGVALIATALILGLFVLRNGFDLDTPSSADAGTGAGTVTAGDTTAVPGGGGGGDDPTTTEATARPPAEVAVLVANASGVAGAAGELTQRLAQAEYRTEPETNAPDQAGQPLETTQVLFIEGSEAEATDLAAAMGAPPDGVAPMPDPPPIELGDAQILILLGLDLANG